MNRSIRQWSVIVLGLFLALMANVTYIQAFQAEELNARPDNRRVLLEEYSRERGPILVGDTDVARSDEVGGEFEYLRVYDQGPAYAPATGFYSIVYGRTAVEQVANSVLAGTDDALFVRRVVDLFSGQANKGGQVRLSLNADAQRAAYEGLAPYVGAVVALEPDTGAILAMATRPSFDPNQLASHDIDEQNAAWSELSADPTQPMLNRALHETYPPGSVFKLVTAAAALESGQYTPNGTIPGPQEYQLPGSTATLPNSNGQACGPNGETTLTDALRISCNTAFAMIGVDLGDDALRAQAEAFGYNSQPLPDMGTATSVYPAELDPAQTAQSAIGQFDVRSTALQVAMTSAGIANGGSVMEPYLIAETLTPDFKRIELTQPEERSVAISSETADELTDMMIEVVENGTGVNGGIPGIPVAGKTGTAERGEGQPPHAWFTSFAPADDPRVAVAVVIAEAPGSSEISGGGLAAPIARAVMEAVLGL